LRGLSLFRGKPSNVVAAFVAAFLVGGREPSASDPADRDRRADRLHEQRGDVGAKHTEHGAERRVSVVWQDDEDGGGSTAFAASEGSRDELSTSRVRRRRLQPSSSIRMLPPGFQREARNLFGQSTREPLRMTRSDVLAEALDILGAAVDSAAAVGDQYDLIGTAFDVFLRGRYDHAGGLATHLTPHTVVTHLARLCLHDLDLLGERPRGPVVGDPCCGTARSQTARPVADATAVEVAA
jgi:hypothetical protein